MGDLLIALGRATFVRYIQVGLLKQYVDNPTQEGNLLDLVCRKELPMLVNAEDGHKVLE